MTLKLEFETNTAAFEANPTKEMSRILWYIAGEVAVGGTKRNIFDTDGAMIGKYEVTGE